MKKIMDSEYKYELIRKLFYSENVSTRERALLINYSHPDIFTEIIW